MYYVYIDYTLEDIPRPFYVGKGSGRRTKVKRRNWAHHKIRRTLGITRTIFAEIEDECEALKLEIELIKRFHTFVDDPEYNQIGCNFTAGGEGGSHPSKSTRAKIAESNRRRKGQKRSETGRKNIRAGILDSLKNREPRKMSDEEKTYRSLCMTGYLVSNETKEKLLASSTLLHQDPVKHDRVYSGLLKAIAHQVLEIDPNTNQIVREFPTIKTAAIAAGLTQKYLRKALREKNEVYLVKRTGKIWRYK